MSDSLFGHVLIGIFIAALLFSVPGGPVIGAGLAGYLEGDRLKRGGAVGALVGLGAAVVVVSFYAVIFELLLRPGLDPRVVPVGLGGTPSILVVQYSLALAVGGGLVGSYFKGYRKTTSAPA